MEHGSLVAHVGASKITRADLALLPVPPATETFKPIPHAELIERIEDTLAYRHIRIEAEEYATSPNGQKLFGLLELSLETSDVRFALGLRTSNDKSMRLAMCAGYRVFVCDNMALNGEFRPLVAKHTKNLELQDSLTVAIDRTQRYFDPLAKRIEEWKTRKIDNAYAKTAIYNAFLASNIKAPVKLLPDVHDYYFNDDRFPEGTFWSLSNAFTSAFKQLKPAKQYEATARLGEYLNNLN